MPRKKQGKPGGPAGKTRGGKRKNASLPRRPASDKQGMFLSKADLSDIIEMRCYKILCLVGHRGVPSQEIRSDQH